MISGSPRCPVGMYKEYELRRPASTNAPEARFYLQVNRSKKLKDPSIWYKDQPLGKNSIGDIAKTMGKRGELSGRKTNHGGRRTALTTLVHANIPPNHIMQLSGHKHVTSINSYSTLSMDQQREMSNILSDLQMPTESNMNPESISNQTAVSDPVVGRSDATVSPNPSMDNSTGLPDLNMIMADIEHFENAPIQTIPLVNEPYPVRQSVTNLPVQVTEQGIDIQAQGACNPSYPPMPFAINFSGANVTNVHINYGPSMQKQSPPISYARRHWKRIRLMDSQSDDE